MQRFIFSQIILLSILLDGFLFSCNCKGIPVLPYLNSCIYYKDIIEKMKEMQLQRTMKDRKLVDELEEFFQDKSCSNSEI